MFVFYLLKMLVSFQVCACFEIGEKLRGGIRLFTILLSWALCNEDIIPYMSDKLNLICDLMNQHKNRNRPY